MSDPHPGYWKQMRFSMTCQADGSSSGEMTHAGQFKSWVRNWRRDRDTGDILCEVQEHPDPAWEAWKRTLDQRASTEVINSNLNVLT